MFSASSSLFSFSPLFLLLLFFFSFLFTFFLFLSLPNYTWIFMNTIRDQEMQLWESWKNIPWKIFRTWKYYIKKIYDNRNKNNINKWDEKALVFVWQLSIRSSVPCKEASHDLKPWVAIFGFHSNAIIIVWDNNNLLHTYLICTIFWIFTYNQWFQNCYDLYVD